MFSGFERIISVIYTNKKERRRQVFKFVFIGASVASKFGELITILALNFKTNGQVFELKFLFICASVASKFGELITNLALDFKTNGQVFELKFLFICASVASKFGELITNLALDFKTNGQVSNLNSCLFVHPWQLSNYKKIKTSFSNKLARKSADFSFKE